MGCDIQDNEEDEFADRQRLKEEENKKEEDAICHAELKEKEGSN